MSKRTVITSTMREFRAAPTKILRRAARTGGTLRLGEFVLSVREDREGDAAPSTLYGAMSGSARVVGSPASLLSANESWSTDE